MILNNVWPNATNAFFLPSRFTHDQNLTDKRVLRVIDAAQALSQRTAFNILFPDLALVRFFYQHFHDCQG